MSQHPASVLRQVLHDQHFIEAPGVFDGVSAKLASTFSFHALYASGGAIARSAGVPDLGLLSLTEVLFHLADITQASHLPIIADADTGFGNALNVARTVREYERLGIAALHLEDQVFPKRCGHLNKKELIHTEDMCQKIRAAKDAQQHPDTLIIARTDAIAVEGFDAALERANHYAKAGADMLFIEAPETVEQIEHIGQTFDTPLCINMFRGGKTPFVPGPQLKEWGYQLKIIPSDVQRASLYAMKNTLAELADTGDTERMTHHMLSFQEREELIGTTTYLDKLEAWSQSTD